MPMHLFCYKLLLLLLIKFSSSSKSSHPSSASVSLSLSVYTCVCTIIPMYVWMGHECATVHTQRPVNLRCLSLPSTSLEKRLCCCFSMVYSWPVSVLGILLSLSLELLTWATTSGFLWVLEIQTWAIMLAQQALWIHLSSPSSFS